MVGLFPILQIIYLGKLTQNCHHYCLILPARPRKAELQKMLDLEAAVKASLNEPQTTSDVTEANIKQRSVDLNVSGCN